MRERIYKERTNEERDRAKINNDMVGEKHIVVERLVNQLCEVCSYNF